MLLEKNFISSELFSTHVGAGNDITTINIGDTNESTHSDNRNIIGQEENLTQTHTALPHLWGALSGFRSRVINFYFYDYYCYY